jgi:hypothetical protein
MQLPQTPPTQPTQDMVQTTIPTTPTPLTAILNNNSNVHQSLCVQKRRLALCVCVWGVCDAEGDGKNVISAVGAGPKVKLPQAYGLCIAHSP